MAKEGFDYSSFTKWAKNFGVAEKEVGEWLQTFVLQEAQDVVTRAKMRTPVDTGALINSYTIGDQNVVLMDDPTGRTGVSSTNKAAQVVNTDQSTGPTAEGVKEYTVVISNPMDYASYIEYGHHLKGQHPYEGKYMLTKAIDETSFLMGPKLLQDFNKYLKDRGVV